MQSEEVLKPAWNNPGGRPNRGRPTIRCCSCWCCRWWWWQWILQIYDDCKVDNCFTTVRLSNLATTDNNTQIMILN